MTSDNMAMPCVSSHNFLGVALVINRSRDGPAFVFHYPEHIHPTTSRSEPRDAVDLEDILLERLSQPTGGRDATGGPSGSISSSSKPEMPPKTTMMMWDHDDHHHHHHHNTHKFLAESGSGTAPWEHVAGFPARDLASILTPARSYHKTMFQLSLDPLYCVSYPIHVPENGKWKKTKKTKAKGNKSVVVVDDAATAANESEGPSGGGKSSSDGLRDNKKKDNNKDNDEEKRSSMTMFNLVFILHPNKSQVKELIESLYTNIIKKANKAYRYSQQHSEFVWKESKRILTAKDKAREQQKSMSLLWKDLLQNSSLAASIHDIYQAVSQNKIAALHLETAAGALSPSFQIPIPYCIADLPQEHDRDQQRGLWLTTTNISTGPDAPLEEQGYLDRNFALLLMDDEKKITAELQSDPDPTTISMVEFVRLSKPTMSFHQVAQSHVLTLSQVRRYAQHFIFWRRAIAIPPLHARDVYIVSPNCDTTRLPDDSQEWTRLFPVAPPLSNFLAELSQAPRPFKHFPPSKAHRPSYLLMLAWLMRRGWVTQLCTFAYVIVWPEIIYEVDYELEAEELSQTRDDSSSNLSIGLGISTSTTGSTSPLLPIDEISPSEIPPPIDNNNNNNTTVKAAELARLERIATKAHLEATEKLITHTRRVPPQPTSHPSLNDAAHLRHLTPHIILDAKKATGKESRYLSAIAKRFKDEKLRAAWQNFSKYFDGRCALERIALQEDLKRKEVWLQLTAMTEFLMCMRHW